jgi:hypothetical protein
LKEPKVDELARAYFKIQQFNRVFKPMEGLQKGTIFPELYRPYEPKSRTQRGGLLNG